MYAMYSKVEIICNEHKEKITKRLCTISDNLAQICNSSTNQFHVVLFLLFVTTFNVIHQRNHIITLARCTCTLKK